MPSSRHETLTEMFRHRPSLAAELLAEALGVELPAYQQTRVEPADCTDFTPTEYRADAVVVLTSVDMPVLAVIVEVQLRRDPRKRRSWPAYLVTLGARLQCPAMLLVVCVDPAIARWCATPIEIGHPGFRLVPLVLAPNHVPVITDPALAGQDPELAVLSAMAHGAVPTNTAVLDALLGALTAVDDERATRYADLVFKALPAAARGYLLEALMPTRRYEYQSAEVRKFVFQGRAEGRAEAKSTAVLDVLDARGVHIPEQVRRQVTECHDLDQLDVWVRRAGTAEKIDDLFD